MSENTPITESEPIREGKPAFTRAQYVAFGGLGLVLLLAITHENFLIALAALTVAVLAVPMASWMTILFFTAVIGLRVPMNETTIPVGGFRFYPGDMSLYLVGLAAVFAFVETRRNQRPELFRGPWSESRIVVLALMAIPWGVISMGIGIQRGLPMRDALGDFRRLYLYMLAMLIPLALPLRRHHLRALHGSILAGGAGAVLYGLYRVATGHMYRAQTQHGDYPRLLADDEIITLAILLAYAVATLASRSGLFRRLFAFGAAAVSTTLMFISGWRMGIAQAVLAPIITTILVGRQRSKSISTVLMGLVFMGAVAAVGAFGVFTVFSETAGYILPRMQDRMQRYGTPMVSDMRYYAYRSALDQYSAHPLVGTGLGHQLSYVKMGSDGTFGFNEGTTHNLFLDVLYQTGPIGLALLVAIHGFFAIYVFRRLKAIPGEYHLLTAALFTGYLCTVLHYSYEPTNVSGMVAMYLMMGLVLRLVRPEEPHDVPAQPAVTNE